MRGRVVSAWDSRSGVRGFDSRLTMPNYNCLGKAIYPNFPHSTATCKMGTQLQAILEFVICACKTPAYESTWHSNVDLLICWGISGAAL
ncbi:hypothetical protein ElyMa_004889900 [Elysia marginata]|uniref:Uncharacterized protein n=1 Tax=Elysia marginata TaxID=1093978 RepID=A0AAV4IU84_9GAST|nr:hypothetical protein ElyMa_004889900 [Elysia marginata]